MLTNFTQGKLSWLRPLRAPDRPCFGQFQLTGRRCGCYFSCGPQIRQPFEVPTDAFELQFQPVGFLAYIPHPPITCASLPPAEYFLDLAPDRTEQPVDPQCR